MLGHVVPLQQRHTDVDDPTGEVLGELGSRGRAGDHTGCGDLLLDLTADVRGVPCRLVGPESSNCCVYDGGREGQVGAGCGSAKVTSGPELKLGQGNEKVVRQMVQATFD